MAFIIEDDVLETNLSVDDAMKLVFSGGIVLPESIVMARVPLGTRDPLDYLGTIQAPSQVALLSSS